MVRIMKLSVKLAIFFFLTNIYLTYTAVSIELITNTDGFGTLKWGTEIESVKNMKLVKSGKTSQGEIKIYTRMSDNLNYNGIALSDIEYGFNNDRLYFVALKTAGAYNYKELKIRQ